MTVPKWNKILLANTRELNLSKTLNCGQSFMWHKTSSPETEGVPEYSSVIASHLITLRQPSLDILEYSGKEEDSTNLDSILLDYFNLKYSLSDLYNSWSKADENFRKKAILYEGIRILRIDPTENIFSFICSSNNNIPRIKQMVEKMCVEYGEFKGRIGEKDFYSFPSTEKLQNTEQKLRELGFGYRAKYISKSAEYLVNLSKEEDVSCIDLLLNLRNLPYEQVKSFLMKLTGVGAKVADCVCLMSMDKLNAIPVDTHVRQIAQRDYGVNVKGVTLTDSGYSQIQDKFTKVFGEYAGWAHSVLFTSELKWSENKEVKETLKRKR